MRAPANRMARSVGGEGRAGGQQLIASFQSDPPAEIEQSNLLNELP